MAWSLDRTFRPFEGTRDALPVAVFRIAFFSGLALHFFPTLLWLDEAYRPGALRSQEWNEWLFAHFWRYPHGEVRAWSILAMGGCVMAIAGLYPRVAAIVCGVGFYAFASFNALHLQTLALIDAWAILLLWMLCGGGTATLSVEALLRKKPVPAVEPGLLPGLILYQVLLGVFFSGVEKLIAGWPWTNEMGTLLSYPRGFLVRDWVASWGFMRSSFVTHLFSWFTVAVELGTPVGLVFKRTRIVALVLYEAFFLGIIAMLEVPPLFYLTFAPGALLALDDEEVGRLRSWLARVVRR